MKKEDFLTRARETHGYKYKYLSLKDKILANDIIEMMYNDVLYTQKVCKHLIGRCPEKNTPIKTTDEFIEEAKLVWGDKYDYSLVDYKGALKKIKIIFKDIIFEQFASSHLRGNAPEKNLTKENFIRKAKLVHGNKYDYSQINFISGDKAVMIGFKGIFYSQTPYSHLSGNCPENQKLSIRKTNLQFVHESNRIHDYKYNYDKTIYIKNQIKVIITCPIHGDFTQTPLSHIQGSGCPHCIETKSEKEITKYLNKLKLLYIRQHKFEKLHELPFDFYIPSARTCIEFDGIQHFQPVEYFGGLRAYEYLKINDKIKEDYCEENYINLIRIRYDQFHNIEKILLDNLSIFIKR